MNADCIVSLAQHASFREIGDEGVILMTNSGQLYSTNVSGTAFMRRLGPDVTVGTILDAMEEEFEVERQTLANDVDELIAYLSSEGVVRVAEPG